MYHNELTHFGIASQKQLSAERLSSAGPGNTFSGSCGSGRKMTASATSRAARQHIFRPTPDGHAVILVSVRQGSLDSGAPAGWQAITVFSTVGFHPHKHLPPFHQSVRTSPFLDDVWNGTPARSRLRKASVRGCHAIESIWTTLSARTLAKAGLIHNVSPRIAD